MSVTKNLKIYHTVFCILLWVCIGITSIFWEINIHQGRDITVGNAIGMVLFGGTLGPIVPVIVPVIVGVIIITDNWNNVIIEGEEK